ncbi:hypothetical protein [Providencia hangzhouensis]
MEAKKQINEFKLDILKFFGFLSLIVFFLWLGDATLVNAIIAASNMGLLIFTAITVIRLVSDNIDKKLSKSDLIKLEAEKLYTSIYKKQVSVIKEIELIYKKANNDIENENLLYIYGDSLQCINGIFRTIKNISITEFIDERFLMVVCQSANTTNNQILKKTINDYLLLKENLDIKSL